MYVDTAVPSLQTEMPPYRRQLLWVKNKSLARPSIHSAGPLLPHQERVRGPVPHQDVITYSHTPLMQRFNPGLLLHVVADFLDPSPLNQQATRFRIKDSTLQPSFSHRASPSWRRCRLCSTVCFCTQPAWEWTALVAQAPSVQLVPQSRIGIFCDIMSAGPSGAQARSYLSASRPDAPKL
ncbi:hypothetical protein L227DRAFT_240875 [Lentinus tigrinus ALCF2SS1-6]|uniref:Uncharacterized protein n=2 Tax=Lentinus tigrinus TaxID=5365 RepID=A0A5C2S0H2_9APHY|nr:hypothetical protein L227DRAFT_240875 [Lentinus tigrinus ALCF2SS1-6]